MSQPPSTPSVHPFLNFNGRCEEAVRFYAQALDATIEMLLRHRDHPAPGEAGNCGPSDPEKIMCASLRIGSSTVMASDCQGEGQPTFQGISLSLGLATEAEADRRFAALSEGGQVCMPLAPTFWSPRFGVVTDRFGVTWMINVMPASP